MMCARLRTRSETRRLRPICGWARRLNNCLSLGANRAHLAFLSYNKQLLSVIAKLHGLRQTWGAEKHQCE
jgi:hypothetical protein